MLLGFGCMDSPQAGEYAYGVGYTAEHSDNIALVPVDERSDTIHSMVVGMAYQEHTADVVAHVLAQATYNRYQNNSYGDETLYDLNSSAVWTISPQRFLWTLQDVYQQGLVDSTGVYTPTNRTNLNILSTGPDVYLHLSPVHTIQFGARVGDVNTGDVNADNKRTSGTAAWLYMPSAIMTLSLNYQVLDVQYDDTVLNNDFRGQDVFFRIQSQPSLSTYMLDVGKTHVNFARGDDANGSLARLSWTRRSTPESSFGLSASKEFLNTGTDVLNTSTTPTTASGTTSIVTSDVYTSKGGSIFYNHQGSQFGLKFQAEKRKLDFVLTTQDRKETNGNLQLSYLFNGATTTASVYTDYSRIEYIDLDRRDVERNAGVRLDYRLSRDISLGLEGSRHDRDSTLPTYVFVDNRVLFSVAYSSGPLFTPQRRK
jgi:hypothetical protein